MERLSTLLMLAMLGAGCVSLGGCVVAPPRRVRVVHPHRVWVPAHWAGHGHNRHWTRGYWH